MLYTTIIDGDFTHVYKESERVGVFDTDTFLLRVISPKEFKQFERNPEKRKFNIRTIEFNLFNLKQ